MSESEVAATTHPSLRRGLWPILKWTLFAVVIVFVGRRAGEIWNRGELEHVDINVVWLLPAAAAYIAGWLPSVWLWQRLMSAVGGHVGLLDCARAYYCGHLGKYVPGKATVLIIRSVLVKDRGARAGAAALTSTYETLAMIGVGAAVALALSPSILTTAHWRKLPEWSQPVHAYPVLIPAVVAMTGLVSLPMIARLFTWVAVKMTPRDIGNDQVARTARIDTRLLLAGCVAYVFAWMLHGLSLGFTLKAISAGTLDLADWPVWTAAVSCATAIGFVAIFAPGGLGVREGLLIFILASQPAVGGQRAVVAAVLLRAVWFVAEIIAAGALYYRGWKNPETAPSTIVREGLSSDAVHHHSRPE